MFTTHTAGRWHHRGRNLLVDLGGERESDAALEVTASGLSAQALIDPRIDVHAQYALRRLSNNPATSAGASAILDAVKSGRLGGIYKEDQQVPALLARRRGQAWWQLIPPGKDATRVIEADKAPLIVFRDRVRSDPARLDPALVAAWREGDGGAAGVILIPHHRLGFLLSTPATTSLATESEGELDSEIFEPDERQLVRGTLAVPFRFICSIESNFGPDPDDSTRSLFGLSTGVLISPRHVLTTGHCLLENVRGSKRSPLFRVLRLATSARVFPARNGAAPNPAQRIPFGPATVSGSDLRVSDGWRTSAAHNDQADFGLITLPVGFDTSRIGFWGTEGTLIQAIAPGRLLNATARCAGYPGDKCRDQPSVGSATAAEIRSCPETERASTQWVGAGRVVDPAPTDFPAVLRHSIDMVEGMSGGPIWIETAGRRIMVGINTLFRRGSSANEGIRITESLLGEVRAAMRADGIEPLF